MIIIPQDIITTHILRRLPAKSVGRFRCVSKEWLSVTSEPRFIETHQKTLGRNWFLFRSNDGSLCSVPFNDHEAVPTLTTLPLESCNIKIHGSVNGLVLAFGFNLYDTIIVLNPTTKDYVEIPLSSRIQSSGMNGFGYDSISNDYKVVIISFTPTDYWHVGVYNLRKHTWSWKPVSHPSYYDYYYKVRLSGVFVNGFIHWIFHSTSKPIKIIAFSLADEEVSELPPPPSLSDHDTHLVALGEKLGIFNEVKGDVWLMNEYGVQKSWTKIVVYGFDDIPMVKPKVFYDNGKLLFLTGDRLWIYDVEERTFCKSVDVSYIRDYISAYAETLVSPEFS